MRITNNMTTNKMLLNLNRNANAVDVLYSQYASGKKIQLASDNPIIASRTLKFRTNISETEQYSRNVSQGLSWMDISEQGFANSIDIMKTIREKCVQGANDTLSESDRKKITTEIQSLYAQLGAEMNVSYAGRYVFSGYRTDEPPTFEADNAMHYQINQDFTLQDIEKTKAYYKASSQDAPEVYDVYRLKIPYAGATMGATLTATDASGAPTASSPYTITSVPTAAAASYNPAPGQIIFIQDTGELIIAKDVMDQMGAEGTKGLSVSYEKQGFLKGDPNPKVYFSCTDVGTGVSYDMNSQELQFEFGVNTRITINNLSKDVLTAQLYADLKSLVDTLAGIQFSTDAELNAKYTAPPYNLTGEALTDALNAQKKEEEQKYSGLMHDRFTNMLALIDTHNANISTEFTNLGSRMNRLTLIETRLEEDRVSYTKLMSENEDVDYLEVLMRLNSADAVYQAAMKAGASIMQMSLADFIR